MLVTFKLFQTLENKPNGIKLGLSFIEILSLLYIVADTHCSQMQHSKKRLEHGPNENFLSPSWHRPLPRVYEINLLLLCPYCFGLCAQLD